MLVGNFTRDNYSLRKTSATIAQKKCQKSLLAKSPTLSSANFIPATPIIDIYVYIYNMCIYVCGWMDIRIDGKTDRRIDGHMYVYIYIYIY